jgi:hypothetical protein
MPKNIFVSIRFLLFGGRRRYREKMGCGVGFESGPAVMGLRMG